MKYTNLDTKLIVKFLNIFLLIFFINLTSLQADEKKDKDEKYVVIHFYIDKYLILFYCV